MAYLLYSARAGGAISLTHLSPEMTGRLCGPSAPQNAGLTLGDLLHPDDRERQLDQHLQAARDGISFSAIYRLIAVDGRVLWVHDQGVADRDGGGAAILHGYCVDITAFKEVEQQLRANEGQFRALVANIPGAVYRCDAGWTIRFMSDDIEAIVGHPASDFIENRVRTYGSLIHPADRPGVRKAIDEAFKGGVPYSLEYRLSHADGGNRWIAEYGRAISGPEGERLWLDGLILDITERKEAEQARDRAESALKDQAELNRRQALHDSLTGLPNRTLFQDRMDHAELRAARDGIEFALLLLDLDRFKEINDTLGHEAGDRLLCEVSNRLQRAVRRSDSVARLGGDEFACVLEGSSASAAVEVAKRIRRAVYRPFVLDGLSLQVEATIGIATYPAHGEDTDSLLRSADHAMYRAKETGAGLTVFTPSEDMRLPERLMLVSELRRAIDEGELCLYYQPKVALDGGHVVGVEALVRWAHPERGIVPPDEFIPIAQETGLIGPLTRYVITEALRQCRMWSRNGRELPVAVNVSMRNLVDAGFPEEVKKLLRKWKVDPGLLELEITETAIVADLARSKPVIEELSSLGVRISVDDFGTGYFSLVHLKRLPIDALKIDRSFVSNLTTSEEDAAIVRSTIDLGRHLGLVVVAEGVETQEAMATLSQLGCTEAQGYYFSRPVPPDELIAWIDGLAGSFQVRPSQPAKSTVSLGLGKLTIYDVAQVATANASVALDPQARERMKMSRAATERSLNNGDVVYGLTAGVGPQRTVAVPAAEQPQFNRLMILAHCVGHGQPAPTEFTRAAMLVRTEGLALGASGVRPLVAEALIAALNANAIPRAHLLGSVGQADLAPLAEIARALMGDGPDAEVISRAGLEPLELAPREALAMISSNAFSLGIAALAVVRAANALDSLERSASLSYEAFGANLSAIDPAVATLRRQEGIRETVRNMRALLEGGALNGGSRAPRNLQDPLCFRVLPQTHASVRQSLAHLRTVVENDLQSSTDNPAYLADGDRTVANGNHDSTVVVVALDYARLGLAQAITIANERVQKLLDPRFSGLASGLRADHSCPEDGLAAVGHGATALAAEARLLADPVSLEHTTSGLADGIEDRITLAPIGARRLHDMTDLAIRLAAVELMCAAQAVDLRGWQNELGTGTALTYDAVRAWVPFTRSGQAPSGDLDPVVAWLESVATVPTMPALHRAQRIAP